jgi:hypothetical protein
MGGVECRLGPAATPADLAFCISAASGVRETLAQHAGDAHRDGPGIATFLARWCDARSPLHAGVPVLWLEFDHDPRATGRASPFVVYKIAEEIGARETMAVLVREGVGALAVSADAAADAAERCLAALPVGARLLHVGVMSRRGTASVRLVVAVTRSEVSGVLRGLAWPGAASAVGTALEALWPGDSTLAVHLDVGDPIGPRVGVEFYRPSSPLDDPLWNPLLDGLVRMGSCTPAKRSAVAAWPSREPDANDERSSLLRQLLVKVVFEHDDVPEAKAYLAFKPRPLLFGTSQREVLPDANELARGEGG